MDACTHAVHLPERERYIQRHRVRAVVLLLTLWAFGDASTCPHFFYVFINGFDWLVVDADYLDLLNTN